MAKNLDPLIDSDDDEVSDYNMRIDIGKDMLACYSGNQIDDGLPSPSSRGDH